MYNKGGYATLKAMTENRLNMPLCNRHFQEALSAGQRKLSHIISREGDLNGERREKWYLVELICEYIQGCLLSEYFAKNSKEKTHRPPANAPNPIKIIYSLTHHFELIKMEDFNNV